MFNHTSKAQGYCFNYDQLNENTFYEDHEEHEYREDPKTGQLKRVNWETGEFFVRGYFDPLTGKVFRGYDSATPKRGSNIMREVWTTEEAVQNNRQSVKRAVKRSAHKQITSGKEGHIKSTLGSIKGRAKDKGLAFDLDVEYLMSIPSTNCPVFGTEFVWGKRTEHGLDHSPSLDRIDPKKGYIKGNVQYLSNKANRMKNNATIEELKMFANWVLNTMETK